MNAKRFEQLKAEQAMKLPYPEKSFKGKTVIVTGSNTGLGKEAARHFVRCGASRVIMAVRSEEKGEEARTDIETSTGITGSAEVWPLNLSSYASVKAFAKRAAELDRIDAIIENASVAMEKCEMAEGTEISMTVNVYSTFLLAILLLPKLQESAKKFGIQPVLNVVASTVGWPSPFEERSSENILERVDGTSESMMHQR
jgi:retinol dehydrogenase 12